MRSGRMYWYCACERKHAAVSFKNWLFRNAFRANLPAFRPVVGDTVKAQRATAAAVPPYSHGPRLGLSRCSLSIRRLISEGERILVFVEGDGFCASCRNASNAAIDVFLSFLWESRRCRRIAGAQGVFTFCHCVSGQDGIKSLPAANA